MPPGRLTGGGFREGAGGSRSPRRLKVRADLQRSYLNRYRKPILKVRPIHSLSYAVSGRNGGLKIVALSTLETSAVRSSVRVNGDRARDIDLRRAVGVVWTTGLHRHLHLVVRAGAAS